MENSEKSFMVGNIVRYNDVPCKIIAIEEFFDHDKLNCMVTLNKMHPNKKEYEVFKVNVNDVECILLDDDFFVNNGYEFSDSYTEYDKNVVNIIRKDGYGPSITKYTSDLKYSVEYCVAGIIIRTVSDFQNLMNVCGCQRISKSISI